MKSVEFDGHVSSYLATRYIVLAEIQCRSEEVISKVQKKKFHFPKLRHMTLTTFVEFMVPTISSEVTDNLYAEYMVTKGICFLIIFSDILKKIIGRHRHYGTEMLSFSISL